MPKPAETIESILGPDGKLARFIQGFEFRPSQVEMAHVAARAIDNHMPALIEAGTGTGKTFGYLVPAVLSKKKCVISTGTKNLQEQIYHKDIPLLQKVTGRPIDAVMMKGRENYLCLHRYHQYSPQASLLKTSPSEKLRKLQQWLKRTVYGDRGEIPWLADDDTLWTHVSCTSDQCLGTSCAFLDDCFLGRLRSRAARARIIVVNHYLFFADLKVKEAGFGEIIPRFQVAVFDEAHTIEEIATTYFGDSLSTRQLTELMGDLKRACSKIRDLSMRELGHRLDSIHAGCERLNGELDPYEEKGRMEPEFLLTLNRGPARDISRALRAVYDDPDFKNRVNGELRPLLDRARELDRLLEEIFRKRDGNWLNWYEKRKQSITFYASPLNISATLNDLLYDNVQSVLFTSATLSTNGTFEFIRGRLGLPESTLQDICPSHFDFQTQTLFYIPNRLPPPNATYFARDAAREMVRILERTRGRALILFTSYHNLNRVYGILRQRLSYVIFRQGDAPRSVLLRQFSEDIHSVLLATGAFWQGVDVPGEALSCLIIDKLPFDSPGDPLVAARIDAIRRQGGNAFMAYQVPSAIITFKQGIGRLIRKRSDRGVLSILDVRILTSRYGRFFLESLPPITVTHDISAIDRFFSETDSASEVPKVT